MHLEGTNGIRALAVKLDAARVHQCAQSLTRSDKDFVLDKSHGFLTNGPALSSFLRRTAALWSDILRKEAWLAKPVDVTEVEDLLLTEFILAAQARDRRECEAQERLNYRAVAKAEEYLSSRLTQGVSRSELCNITGLSVRSLSRTFSRRWGTGPMGFLKERRMEAAYRELLGADAGVTTVTEVASKYGLTHLGKFAMSYKKMFHESPSETLRH
jgi:AraC-like DNA-binding protein